MSGLERHSEWGRGRAPTPSAFAGPSADKLSPPRRGWSKAAHRRDACATYTTYLSKGGSKLKFAA